MHDAQPGTDAYATCDRKFSPFAKSITGYMAICTQRIDSHFRYLTRHTATMCWFNNPFTGEKKFNIAIPRRLYILFDLVLFYLLFFRPPFSPTFAVLIYTMRRMDATYTCAKHRCQAYLHEGTDLDLLDRRASCDRCFFYFLGSAIFFLRATHTSAPARGVRVHPVLCFITTQTAMTMGAAFTARYGGFWHLAPAFLLSIMELGTFYRSIMLAVDGSWRWTGALDTARATGLHIQYTIMCSYFGSFRKYFNAFQYLLTHHPCSFLKVSVICLVSI